MKTYKKTVELPRLKIEYEEDAESPREWTTLGYFITIDNRMKSPDNNEELKTIIKETGEEAKNVKDHIRRIKKEFSEKIIAIYPISKYEHSEVGYFLGSTFGFDYSNNGFYIVTDKTAKELGAKRKDFEKIIKDELNIYNKYINGEVYSFMLYDKNGKLEDSCGGFYNIEDIREYLPEEWKNEDLNNYLK